MNYLGLVCVFCMMLLVTHSVSADNCGALPECEGVPGEAPGSTCCPISVPFDGGLTLMLAAGGIGMGVKAMRKRKIAARD